MEREKCMVEIYRNGFPAKLNSLLRLRNIQKAELARLTGLSKQIMSDYVKGKSVPGFSNLMLLSTALKVDPSFWYSQKNSDFSFMISSKAERLTEDEALRVLQYIDDIIKNRKEA